MALVAAPMTAFFNLLFTAHGNFKRAGLRPPFLSFPLVARTSPNPTVFVQLGSVLEPPWSIQIGKNSGRANHPYAWKLTPVLDDWMPCDKNSRIEGRASGSSRLPSAEVALYKAFGQERRRSGPFRYLMTFASRPKA